jgi:hypothetical protein
MPNEVIDLYRSRTISAIDVAVYAALCSLRRDYDGVRLNQRKIALMCNISPKTVAASVQRLYSCGLIVNVITPIVKQMKKYQTSIYQLKPLPDSGFFFAPRHILWLTHITPKMFTVYLSCVMPITVNMASHGTVMAIYAIKWGLARVSGRRSCGSSAILRNKG